MNTEKQLFMFQVECYIGAENNEDLCFVLTIAESPKKARENMRKIPSFQCAITTLCEKLLIWLICRLRNTVSTKMDTNLLRLEKINTEKS